MNMREVDRYRKAHVLVDIKRNKTIDPFKIQGIVMDYSKNLLLVQYVYDFRLDGFSILNMKDIVRIRPGHTSIFQFRILKKDGDLNKVKMPFEVKLFDWKTAIQSVAVKRPLLILEVEGPKFKRFLIGKVIDLKSEYVVFHHFDGEGKWNKHYSQMKYQDITRLQFDAYYLKKYSRHVNV